MEIIRSVQSLRKKTKLLIKQHKQIGFVPTMGFLHEGHLSLMKEARKANDILIVSIFVNPLQFGENEDFEQYPRDEEQDEKLAKEIGADILFIPAVKEMYPKKMQISMHVTDRTEMLCGRSRPGHFDGVITVLTKLFNMINPDRVYFGMKDAQQVAVVDLLIQNLNFPVQLVGLPTVREENGLAKSSRNVNLSRDEKEEAIWIYKALKKGQQFVIDGEKNPAMIKKEVMDTIKHNTSGEIDYVELLSYPGLKPVMEVKGQVILAAAVHFEKARLIDNLLFDESGRTIHVFKSEE
ncbi:pantoate--beta-alanine ligase [Virgibacillus sp. YIM 98842]|jgi:pantoate--beta-alanine ligase|uniref:pantoate--beta-alanine ligase n=1 Tax=Virgibacillus sp. YIM 98842 TaxID=2663533 RepID=UPI0013D9F255|nr:pantoate--beta-alanine ligase [Virgibacillus sp. YIM 98842]